jgi:zeaxanthin glucosyltransferase
MRIGFACMPLTGHLNPMCALARKLQSRGNDVVFFGVPAAAPAVRAAQLPFVPFGETEYPAGSIETAWRGISTLQGEDVARYTLGKLVPGLMTTAFEHLPQRLTEAGVDAIVLDILYSFLELVPIQLAMPYVHISPHPFLDPTGAIPPHFFSWAHDTSPEAVARNREGLRTVGALLAPVLGIARSYAEAKGIRVDWASPTGSASKLAVITQLPREFDFPRPGWPPQFHYTGPFHDPERREDTPFPWDRVTGQPLIYASMGTLVNGLPHVHRAIVEAIRSLPEMQVVLSIGANIRPDDLGALPANTIVVRTAPQLAVLKRAALCITHAGLNTVLESLALGVPMVAIPNCHDQPGVAARIAYHGVGEFVELDQLTVDGLSTRIRQVTSNPSYRERATYFQEVIAKTRGLDLAAGLIERAFGIAPSSGAASSSASA